MDIPAKPVCYLDLDDTILCHDAEHGGAGAPGAAEFVRFLLHHFEVRWLTRWCPDGRLSDEQLADLAERLGMPPAELGGIRNARPFVEQLTSYAKYHGIDFEEAAGGRPFVWLEDALTDHDRAALEWRGLGDSHIACDVTRDPGRLAAVRRLLAERFGLDRSGGAGAER